MIFEASERDKAFLLGKADFACNYARRHNPYKAEPLKGEWYKGYDMAQREQMQHNLKAIGVKP